MLPLSRIPYLPLLVAMLVAGACSRNPATRKLEAFMPKRNEEIALGQEAALSLRGSLELYDDAATRELVERVGRRIAAATERPELPWSFTLVDDHEPTAFALPGGSVYVTRGLLACLNSEAELAAVMAHEAAHVTARHGLRGLHRLARAQHRDGRSSVETQLPTLHAAGTRAMVRFLERSREDELLADRLALRYLERATYEPSALAETLRTLGSLHGSPGLEEPQTHPTTVHRRAQVLAALGHEAAAPVPDAEFLASIEGLVYGPDPLEGYIDDGTFIHPRMGFALDLPEHWTVAYRGGRAVAKSLDGDTLLTVSESPAVSVRAGMNDVFMNAVKKLDPWDGELAGNPAAMAQLETMTPDDRPLHAFVGLVEFEGRIVQVVAFSASPQWPAKEVRKAFRSFSAATPSQKNVEPMVIELMGVANATTLRELYDRNPSSVPLSVVARLNHVESDDTLVPDQPLKRIRGFNPDFASVRRSL